MFYLINNFNEIFIVSVFCVQRYLTKKKKYKRRPFLGLNKNIQRPKTLLIRRPSLKEIPKDCTYE